VRWLVVRLCALNDEPHENGRGDENHQPAHPFRRPPIIFNPSRPPIPPPELGFGVGDNRSLVDHRRASWILSDIVWRGAFHRHIKTIGGRTAMPAMNAQLESEFRFAVRPAINTAKTQTVASTVLSDMSCMP
jgi:hypothetical protein